MDQLPNPREIEAYLQIQKGAFGVVGIVDFLGLLSAWGECVEECCLADVDLDRDVGITDFLILLGNWTL